jgi:hypothetical protein
MGTQGYRANYREAFQCANAQLGDIYDEYHALEMRKQYLENALMALETFLEVDRSFATQDVYQPEPVPTEAARQFETVPEPAVHYAPPANLTKHPVVPEPVVATSCASVSEANADPIQARINRALGLAVA